jgi:hypothetical protein
MFDNEIRIDSKADLNPIAHTNLGAVEGYVMKTIKGRSIYAYEGIPFAESTGGPNRFKVTTIEGSMMVDIDYMLNIDRRIKYSVSFCKYSLATDPKVSLVRNLARKAS